MAELLIAFETVSPRVMQVAALIDAVLCNEGYTDSYEDAPAILPGSPVLQYAVDGSLFRVTVEEI